MNALLLDASVILAAFDVDDELHEPAAAILVDAGATLATLDLARYEAMNVAVRAWRSAAVVGSSLLEAIDRIDADGGAIRSTGPLLTRAAQLADLLSKGLACSPAEAARTLAEPYGAHFPLP